MAELDIMNCQSLGGTARQLIVDLCYPVGAFYISANSTSPATLFGYGTWQAVPADYSLWTVTSGSAGYDQIDNYGAAPNIAGDFGAKTWESDSNGRGAMWWNWTDAGVTPKGTSKDKNTRVVFNASDGECGTSKVTYNSDSYLPNIPTFANNVYGKQAYIKPRSIKVYAWQRTA